MNKQLNSPLGRMRQGKGIVTWCLFFALLLSPVFISAEPAAASSAKELPELETAHFTPIQINFNTYTPTAFGSEDVNPTMTIEDGGNTLHLKGNSWKKISLPYTVTAYTVIEFDFKSPVQGEVHGIGFDDNQSISSGYIHKLYGTQTWGSTSLRTDTPPSL